MANLETYLKAIEFEIHESKKEGVNPKICFTNIEFCVNKIRELQQGHNGKVYSIGHLEDLGYEFMYYGDKEMCKIWFDKGESLIIVKGKKFDDIDELILDRGFIREFICNIKKKV